MKYAEQVQQIKQQHPGHLVVFRVGDFFEAYGDDAKVMAEALDIVLVSRKMGDERVPMAGVPFYRGEDAMAALVKAGHKVALVEPVGDTPIDGVMPRKTRPLSIHVDRDDANADWTKGRSRESELKIHDRLGRRWRRG